jgi:hypothetical protein
VLSGSYRPPSYLPLTVSPAGLANNDVLGRVGRVRRRLFESASSNVREDRASAVRLAAVCTVKKMMTLLSPRAYKITIFPWMQSKVNALTVGRTKQTLGSGGIKQYSHVDAFAERIR